MPAKKSSPKPGKAHKAVPAKTVAKKPVVARKAAPAKVVKPVKPVRASKPAAKPVTPAKKATPAAAKELEIKPHVSSPPARSDVKSTATNLRNAPTPEVVDEAEAGENNSLLAGPRNVQPYVVKRGEQYMSKEQLEHFRQILQNWKQDLMLEVDRTVSHMKDEAANFPDPNDRATQEEEFSLELRTRDRERKLIRKIDEALKRIEDGSYGYCLETGEQIGIKRLEARPVATLSIEAQERRERREKQYGDRDDRYR
jgi:DnaK suppressor protein